MRKAFGTKIRSKWEDRSPGSAESRKRVNTQARALDGEDYRMHIGASSRERGSVDVDGQ